MTEDSTPPQGCRWDGHGFVVSPMMHVGSFLGQCEEALENEDERLPTKMLKSDQELAEAMGTTLEIVHELGKVCGPESLKCPAEDVTPLDEGCLGTEKGIPAGAEQLKTVQLRHRKYSRYERKYRKSEEHMDCFATYADDEEEDCVERTTAILDVTFFRPSEAISSKNVYRSFYIDRELLVLADQKLTELRDKIVCAADLFIPHGEYSECPDATKEQAQDIYKSSYFLIEDDFYNDFRDSYSKDLSKCVVDWMKPRKTMTSKSMEDVTFNDLNIRLGYPYLYCHLGNCQHIMVFTDLRLLTNTDCQDLSRYPVLTHKPYWRRNICLCCGIYTARWVTLEDSFSTTDPSFFCEKCFRMLHYDKNGKKLGSFQAYPYVDPGIFS
ncbi:snRNA-activating protein complex subunit 3-like [Asterias rubens]|uniref:snRNA-activating protein complex subunit 3-like n=1 Tax=Asterias rubens TaxID=7604 RepID=UPI001455B229|nr:snRNA-activating protein complex subunit 3-like [Asterias rubens]XP_033634606.1 snRNA-activating protein complex subunit 3-like [Asterias rubens]XP_033634607.1 snRNA-activating protein complex subunit 3-like [Asterias rubens]